MVTITLILIILLSILVITLIINHNKTKANFEKKIEMLHHLIEELNTNLISKNQKVKLSDDFKQKIKESNHTLSKSIFDLNLELFEELYPSKNK